MNIAKALKRIFKIWRLLVDFGTRLSAIEASLHRLESSDFRIDGDLALRRVGALEMLVTELHEVEPYCNGEELDEARELLIGMQRSLDIERSEFESRRAAYSETPDAPPGETPQTG